MQLRNTGSPKPFFDAPPKLGAYDGEKDENAARMAQTPETEKYGFRFGVRKTGLL